MSYNWEQNEQLRHCLTDRMQLPIQSIVLGLTLALSAVVRAQPAAPEATIPSYPAAPEHSTPIDLTLHSAAVVPLTPLDLALPPAAVAPLTPLDLTLHPAAAPQSAPIDSTQQWAAAEVDRVARWVTDSGDNGGLPYLLIDKVNARVFAFNPAGQLQGSTPALLGMGHGDRLIVPNDTKMEAMPPQVRITPAGRFVSRLAIDSHGKELLVLDYGASISLHAVVKGTPKEHRAERLASATSQDNRISFGCINVPAAFYATIVSPAFTDTKGIVYVLPETGPASELFGFRPVDAAVPGAQQSSAGTNTRAAQAVPALDAR